MKRCAFLTLDDPTGFVIDDDLVLPAMAEAGWWVDSVSWRAAVDWNDWQAVLIRTPWDYQDDPDAFLATLEAIDASSAWLENPLETVRWNLRKTYLRDLAAKGVLIVPTLWGLDEPPSAPSLRACFDAPEFADESSADIKAGIKAGIVVKPVVSANADDTFRLGSDVTDDELATVATTFTRHDGSVRPFMVQPFLRNIVEEGEVSLFYFGGDFSHAILKTPKGGDFRVQEEHGGLIKTLDVDQATRARIEGRGLRALAALEPMPLYARIDLVRTAADDFAVMEVELIEPSLYFRTDPEAPRNFARAFARWMA